MLKSSENKGFKRKLFWYQLLQERPKIVFLFGELIPEGKTTDALAAYLYSRKTDHDKVLIVCPKSAFLPGKKISLNVLMVRE